MTVTVCHRGTVAYPAPITLPLFRLEPQWGPAASLPQIQGPDRSKGLPLVVLETGV